MVTKSKSLNKKLKEIDEMLTNKDFETSLEIVEDELSDSSYSQQDLKNLHEYKIKIYQALENYQDEIKNRNYSKEEFWKQIYHKNTVDFIYFVTFMKIYWMTLESSDYKQLQAIFSDKKVSIETKVSIFNILKKSNINHDFEYLNSTNLLGKKKGKVIINPIKDVENLEQVQQLEQELIEYNAKHKLKNINVCFDVLNTLSLAYFPAVIPKKFKIIESIVEIADCLTEEDDKKFNESKLLLNPLGLILLSALGETENLESEEIDDYDIKNDYGDFFDFFNTDLLDEDDKDDAYYMNEVETIKKEIKTETKKQSKPKKQTKIKKPSKLN